MIYKIGKYYETAIQKLFRIPFRFSFFRLFSDRPILPVTSHLPTAPVIATTIMPKTAKDTETIQTTIQDGFKKMMSLPKKVIEKKKTVQKKKKAEKKSKKKDQESKRNQYIFIYNNYTVDGENNLRLWLTEYCKYAVFGHEIAPTTGTPHLQGYMNLKKQDRMTGIHSKLKKIGVKLALKEAYGDAKENRVYCTKDANDIFETGNIQLCSQGARVDLVRYAEYVDTNPFVTWGQVLRNHEVNSVAARYTRFARELFDTRPVEIEPFELEFGLQDWQIEFIEILKGPPIRRQIIWPWSDEHSTGKSTFYTYLRSRPEILNNKRILSGSMDLKRTLYAYDRHDIVWFDIPKTSEFKNEKFERLRDSTIEPMSNHGFLLSTFQNPVEKYVKCHVVVTSNYPPPHDALPKRIREISIGPLVDKTSRGLEKPLTPQDDEEDPELEMIVAQAEEIRKEKEEADKLLSERQLQILEYNHN